MPRYDIDLFVNAKDNASAVINDINNDVSLMGEIFEEVAGGLIVEAATAALGALTDLGKATAGQVLNASLGLNESLGDLQTQLGLSADEANNLNDVVRDVFGNNFGDSVQDVTDAVVIVRRELGALADGEMQIITERAMAIQDAFGIGVEESVDGVAAAMEAFGLSSTEATDLVTAGLQRIPADDFLETLTEYGPQFAEAGLSAEEFFSLLETGTGQGIIGTDKVADAFKEFGIRAREASPAVREATDTLFALTDVDFAGSGEFFEDLRTGAIDGADAFDTVIGALQQIEDPIQRQQLGVELLGSQFEDLGSILDDVDIDSTSFEDLLGAGEDLNKQYGSFGDLFQAIGRKAIVALTPLTDVLLNMGSTLVPIAEDAMNSLIGAMQPIIDIAENIGDTFQDNIADGEGIFEALQGALEDVFPEFENITTAVGEFLATIGPTINKIMSFITENVKLQDVLAVIGGIIVGVVIPALVGIVQSAAPVIAAFVAAVAAVAALRRAWEEDFLGIRSAVTEVFEEGVLPLLQTVFRALSEEGPGIIDMFKQAWEDLQPALNAVMAFIAETVIPLLTDLAVNYLQQVASNVQLLAQFWRDTLKPALETVWGFIVESLIPALTDLVSNGITIVSSAVNALSDVWQNTLQPALETVWGFINESVIPIFTLLIDVGIELLRIATDKLSSAWDRLKEALDPVFATLSDNIMPIFEEIEGFLSGKFADAMSNLASGALQTLSNGFDALSGVLQDLIGFLERVLELLRAVGNEDTPDMPSGLGPPPGGPSGLGPPGAGSGPSGFGGPDSVFGTLAGMTSGFDSFQPPAAPAMATPGSGGPRRVHNTTYNVYLDNRDRMEEVQGDLNVMQARQGRR